MKQCSVCAVIMTLTMSFSLSAPAAIGGVISVTVSSQATAGSRSSGAQADKEAPLLKPGEPVSREIAGSEKDIEMSAAAILSCAKTAADERD